MITRKDFVEALRVLHETDSITKIVTRAKRIDVHFMSDGHDGLLVLPNPPTLNDNNNRNKAKPKSTASLTKDATTTHNN